MRKNTHIFLVRISQGGTLAAGIVLLVASGCAMVDDEVEDGELVDVDLAEGDVVDQDTLPPGQIDACSIPWPPDPEGRTFCEVFERDIVLDADGCFCVGS